MIVRRLALCVLIGATMIACGGSRAKHEAALPTAPAFDVDASADETSEAGSALAQADAGDPTASLPALPPSTPPEPAPARTAAPPGSADSAHAFLEQFVAPNADYAALTRLLRPTTSDYRALFSPPGTAAKIEASQAKDWDSNKAVIKPKPGQTEIKLWSATGDDLLSGTGNAKEFPAGYGKVAKYLAPAAVYFRFKFVEPGKDTGTAYDGLSWVHGHWVIVPKPWRAFESKHASDDDADPPKKKPKKKKK